MEKNGQKKDSSWQAVQDKLAAENGLAIVIVDENASVLAESNNNSICEVLHNSEEFAPECAKHCDKAFALASANGKPVEFKCFAGLSCVAVPLKTKEKQVAAIVGKAFVKAEEYRKVTERAISGDWKKFPPTKFFENVLLTSSPEHLQSLAAKLENLSGEQLDALEAMLAGTEVSDEEIDLLETFETQKEIAAPEIEESETFEEEKSSQADEIAKLVEQFHSATPQTAIVSDKIARKRNEEAEEVAAWRSLFGSILKLSYKKACISILRFLTRRYSVFNLAWMERADNHLETAFAVGNLNAQSFQISISVDDERLLDAVARETSLEFRERQYNGEKANPRIIRLFPVAIGGEIQSALVVGDEIADERVNRKIVRFCHEIASEIEILRLREELMRRGWLERAIQKFNESLKNIDSEDLWTSLVQISAELMKAERSSLLLFDEKSDTFTVKAATGARADIIKNETIGVGMRVASSVLRDGKAAVVRDVNKIGLRAAPMEWRYKTDSFISYPITIGKRKIGVLNITDRADGEMYGEEDLEFLDAIAPQLGVLIDRITLKRQAGEYEQLSVTDALTGLLNRRYLEERMSEEISRSSRYGHPMSFMMIDVDFFKSYNDAFGHAEGDKALKLVGQCFKETLRGADVAARYGGEEFSILLPETTLDEAETIAERIREKVETTCFPNRQVTVSIGITGCPFGTSSPHDLIQAADKALYEAKRRGRNNVQVYEHLEKDSDVKM